MRKIESQEEIEERKKRNIRIVSIVLLGIMIFSSVGYSFFSNPSGSTTKTNDNGAEDIGGQWRFLYDNVAHIVSSSPDSARNVSFDAVPLLQDYSGNVVYIASKSEAIYSEIYQNLYQYAGRMQRACYENCTDQNLPEKNCNDTLIVYTEANVNKVSQRQGCVFIEGDIRAVDAFIYKIFGII